MSGIAVTRDDMRRDLDAWLARVKAGETLVILDAGLPVAEIKPVEPAVRELRPYALAAGEFRVPDDFDTSLP